MVGHRLIWAREAVVKTARHEPGRVGAWGLVLAFALFVLVRGKDVGWDFRNYHWYTPYALLTGRRGFDVAVGQHATYYNPLSDVPLYAASQVMPAWLVALFFGLFQGLNAILLYELARSSFEGPVDARRSWFALALAACGMLGGMTLLLAGTTSHDLTVSVFVLAALVLLMRLDPRAAGTRSDLWLAAGAGLAGGLAVGLKLTMAAYALGLAAGLLMLTAPWRARLTRLAALGAGGFVGTLIFGGYWALTLWHETGNPFFPFFNDLIGSPLLLSASYRDMRFVPVGVFDTLAFPFLFTFDWSRVVEFPFRDVKIMIAYVVIPVALALWATGYAARERFFAPRAARLLFVFAAISYVAWLELFAVYRYLATVEMLAPLMIVIAIDFVPVAARYRAIAALVILVAAVAAIRWDAAFELRPAWRTTMVSIDVPPIAEPDKTMVLMAGIEPMSYIIPAFPPQIPFLRVDSYLDSPQSNTPFGHAMRVRIDAHQGPFFGVFIYWEDERAKAAFASYGLSFDLSKCGQVTSNIGPALRWCTLERRATAP